MTSRELSRRIAWHNRLNLAVGLALIPPVAMAWYATYFLLTRGISYIQEPDVYFHSFYVPPTPLALKITWGFLALLALDAVWRISPALYRDVYSDDEIHDPCLRIGRTMITYRRILYEPTGGALLAYVFLAYAPRATATACEFLFDRVPATPLAVSEAVSTLYELRSAKRWQPISVYQNFPNGVQLLVSMKLAWLRVYNEELEIRAQPIGE